MDRCTAHPPEDELVTKDGKIKAMFLPANTTSLIQPMDQGIIAILKKKELLSNLLLVEERPLPDAMKSVTIKDAMYISEKVGSTVKSETISKCRLKVLNNF